MLLPESLLKYLNFGGASVELLHDGVNRTFLAVRQMPFEKLVIREAAETKIPPSTLQGEMFWLSYLVDERFPCVMPYVEDDWHKNIVEIDGRVFALYKFIQGTEPNADIVPNYYLAGKTLRNLHDRNLKHVNMAARQRATYDVETVVKRFVPVIQSSPLFNDTDKTRLLNAAKDIARNFPADLQFIHGDFHLGNLLMTDMGIKVLDFDECGFGSKFYDLGTMRLHTLANNKDDAWDAFLNGYGLWDRADPDLKYGCAARIFYMISKLPERVETIHGMAERAGDIISRYLSYLEKILQP